MSSKRKHPLFFSSNIDKQEKENRLIQLMSATREGLSKAVGNSASVTYPKAFSFLSVAEPDLFEDVGKYFKQEAQVPVLAEHFRQLAIVKGSKYTPEHYIKLELDDLLKSLSLVKKDKFKSLEKREVQLKVALRYFELEKEKGAKKGKEREQSEEKSLDLVKVHEDRALRRDFETVERNKNIYKKVEVTEDGFREFILPNKRLMKIRFLHNLPAEKMTGVDLVYELINVETNKIRFLHLQYKMWDGYSFSINTPREVRQMQRLQGKFCHSNFCDKGKKGELPYRMPYCSAFYRPTHKYQSKHANIITTGIHIPVCCVAKTSKPFSIDKDNLYTQGLSNSVFDELFRNGLIGSAWMDLDKVQKFYKANKIIESQDSLVLNIRDETGHKLSELRDKSYLKDII